MASAEGSAHSYKMTSLDTLDINQHFQDAMDVIQHHSNHSYYEQEFSHYKLLGGRPHCCLITPPPDTPALAYDWNDSTQSWPHVIPDVSLGISLPAESPFCPILPPQKISKGRKKLRLYEYLHEALNDPDMGDSIQWTDSGSGTFHFVSKNKEKLAECWGQRKGNRKTMTYQKMARALRNYSRSGEIIKVRRKLTYQFNPDILHRLGSSQSSHLPYHSGAPVEEVHGQQDRDQNHDQVEHNYYTPVVDWQGWYGHYQLQEDYDLAASFSSHSAAKL